MLIFLGFAVTASLPVKDNLPIITQHWFSVKPNHCVESAVVVSGHDI